MGNLTFNNTLPMHLIMLPNNSESTDVNFMMDYTHRSPAGLDENKAKGSLQSSGIEYEAHSDDKCEPKYFVFNSRVSERPKTLMSPSHVGSEFLFPKMRWPGTAIHVGMLNIWCCLCFADGLCNSYPSICFCMPP